MKSKVRLEETENRRRLHIGAYFTDLNETEYRDLVNIFSGRGVPPTAMKSKEEIWDEIDRQWWDSDTDFSSRDTVVLKAMQEYADQETAALKERVRELENGLENLVQLKMWKDKFGSDEHYIRHKPEVWEAARKLLNKQP